MGEGECAYWDVLTFPARKQVDRIRYPVTKTALETVDRGWPQEEMGSIPGTDQLKQNHCSFRQQDISQCLFSLSEDMVRTRRKECGAHRFTFPGVKVQIVPVCPLDVSLMEDHKLSSRLPPSWLRHIFVILVSASSVMVLALSTFVSSTTLWSFVRRRKRTRDGRKIRRTRGPQVHSTC